MNKDKEQISEEDLKNEFRINHYIDFAILVLFVIAAVLHKIRIASCVALIIGDALVVGRMIRTAKFNHFAKATGSRDKAISIALDILVIAASIWFILGM